MARYCVCTHNISILIFYSTIVLHLSKFSLVSLSKPVILYENKGTDLGTRFIEGLDWNKIGVTVSSQFINSVMSSAHSICSTTTAPALWKHTINLIKQDMATKTVRKPPADSL
jgi:hypothetical protein